MLADPQSVTVNAVAISLPKVVANPTSSVFASSDATLKLSTSQQSGKKLRSLIRLDQTKISTNPLSDVKLSTGAAVYLVIERDRIGFTTTDLLNIWKALRDNLDASSSLVFKAIVESQV